MDAFSFVLFIDCLAMGYIRSQLLGDQRKGRIGICGRRRERGNRSGNGAAAVRVRRRRRIVSMGVFVGGVLCTRSAWAMGGPLDGSG
jgi:hypothetical protein